jgi:hypothetical protein
VLLVVFVLEAEELLVLAGVFAVLAVLVVVVVVVVFVVLLALAGALDEQAAQAARPIRSAARSTLIFIYCKPYLLLRRLFYPHGLDYPCDDCPACPQAMRSYLRTPGRN